MIKNHNDLPSKVKEYLSGCKVIQQLSGRLKDQIIQYQTESGMTYFLKYGYGIAAENLRTESSILKWLKKRKLATPDILCFHEEGKFAYSLMTEVAGVPPYKLKDLSKHILLEIVAQSLREFHQLSKEEIPCTDTLMRDLLLIDKYLSLNVIDVQKFQQNNLGKHPHEVFDYLCSHMSLMENNVVTHGDFCLPNILIKEKKWGYIDLADCGQGDKYKDLSSLEGSIKRNFGQEWIKVFYQCYDSTLEVDQEKIRYFQLIDQFDYCLNIDLYNHQVKNRSS